MTDEPRLDHVSNMIRTLGRSERQRWTRSRRPPTGEAKAPNDYVTPWDRRIEAALRQKLHDWMPESVVVGEEGGGNARGVVPTRWILDPVDGTANLMHGVPHWAISVALERHGVVIAGWVYDVLRDELFEARRGAGATRNGHRLQVSKTTGLGQALIALGTPVDKARADAYWPVWQRVFAAVQDVRRMGSAALDLAWVAAGRWDGYAEGQLHWWDWAAGALLVEEAGGRVTTWRGNPLTPANAANGLLATNGCLHETLRAVIQDATVSDAERS